MKSKVWLALLLCLAAVASGCSTTGAASLAAQHASTQTEPTQTQPTQPRAARTQSAYGSLNTFQALTLEGETFTQENLADKDVTVVNFWSVTCGPCVGEMPDLASIEKALPENVQLITVCLDGARGSEDAKKVLDNAGFTGITLIGVDGDALAVAQKILYIPTTLFFDKDGNAVGETIIGGQRDLAKTYTEAINAILKELGKDEISLEK